MSLFWSLVCVSMSLFIHCADQLLPRLSTAPGHFLVLCSAPRQCAGVSGSSYLGQGLGKMLIRWVSFLPSISYVQKWEFPGRNLSKRLCFPCEENWGMAEENFSDKPNRRIRLRQLEWEERKEQWQAVRSVAARMEVGGEHPQNAEPWGCSAGSMQTLESRDSTSSQVNWTTPPPTEPWICSFFFKPEGLSWLFLIIFRYYIEVVMWCLWVCGRNFLKQ